MLKFDFKINENTDYSVLKKRDRIYFDINIWIDLAEAKTNGLKNLQELIRILVEAGKIFCPLHFSILSELYTQSYNSMLKVGKLMEEFSLNFSFANWDEIWKSEVRNFVYSYLHKTKYVVEDEILFVPFIGYLSSKASLIYPDGYKKEFAEEVNSLQKNISKFTLTDFIKISNGAKDIVRKDHSAYIKDEWLNALKRAKGNKAKLRYENETFTSKTRILTTLFEINKELSPENLLKITEYLNSFPKDNKGRIFNSIIGFLPTLRNEVEILSVVSLDKQRKVTMNDFFDIENLIVPLAYSDVLVSRDRWIRSLLKVTDLPEKNNCKYFYDFEGLIKYLSNNYLRN